jgi:hypothetical protein
LFFEVNLLYNKNEINTGSMPMNELKDKAHKLIDSVPDEKMPQVVIILEGIKSIIEDELDDWDLEMVKEAQKALKKGDFVSFEDVLKEAGLSAKDL